MDEKKNTVLFSDSEKVIAEVGQNYLDSFLTGGGFSKTVLVLTDKRLYIKGKRLSRTGGVKVSIDFNINDVTGTIYSIRSLALLRILLLLIGIAGAGAMAIIGSIPLAVAAFVLFLIFSLLVRDVRHLGIISHGSEYVFPVHRYNNDVIGSFRQAVALMVEQHREK